MGILGMFGNSNRPASGYTDPLTVMSSDGAPMSIPSAATVVAPLAKPKFDDVGGLGDRLSAFAAALKAAGGNQEGANAIIADLDSRQKQADEYTRQLALARFKAANPEAGSVQKNFQFFSQIGRPDLAKSYAEAEGNPMVLGTDPTTGSLRFFPKGGMPGMNGPATPAVPQIGAIEDGHVFLGGDPANPSSWRKQ
jgi:hypothetical protein